MDGPPPPEEDFTTLSVADRIQHKNWKARVSGYDALIKLFQNSASDSDPVFRPYLSNSDTLRKIVSDANAVAQEKGVELVVNLVKYSGENASRTRDAVLPVVVEKCLGSTRSGTKSHSLELILQYVEVSNTGADIVTEVLSGISSKQPKVVAGSVSVLKEIVRAFGITIVPPAPILKSIPKMFAHTDKTVRLEAMQLVQVLYRGMGPAIEPFLNELKPVQVKEINESFENMDKEGVGKGTLRPERITREQQQRGEQDLAEPNATESVNELAPPDPRQFAEEVDIGPKLPSGFAEAMASTKWKERKEALDEVHAVLSKALRIKDTPELAAVIKLLASRMTDANINCVITASGCLDALARGLQGSFAKYTEIVVPPMLDRLKERKQTVTDAIGSALDSVFTTITIGDILGMITPALSSKNPQVKEGTLKFLHRCLAVTPAPPPAQQVKPLSESLASLLGDSFEGARNEAALCLGTLMKIVGERPLNAIMDTIDDVRKVKVKEAFESATVRCKPVGATTKPPSAVAGPAKKPLTSQTRKADAVMVSEDMPAAEADTPPPPKVSKAPPARPLSKKPTSSPQESAAQVVDAPKPPVKKMAAPPGNTNSSKQAKAASQIAPSAEVKFKHSAEEADALASELIPTSIATDFGDANWKTRLAALEELTSWLEGCVETVDSEVLIRFLAKKGWSEKNFQVSAKLYGILYLLAERCPSFGRASVVLSVPHLSEKLGDIKLKKPAGDALVIFAEKTSLSFVLSQAYETLEKQKAPKVLADSVAWMDQTLQEFGIAGLSLRGLIEFLKSCLKNSNALVRSNATKALVTVKLFAGGGIRDLLEDLNPQLLSTIEKEFENSEGRPVPTPVRTCAEASSAPDAGGKKPAQGTDPLDDLFPRVEIDRLISGTNILTELKSDAWKNRKEALELLQSILDVGSNKRLKPSMGDIGQALKARINDTNKACQILALDIVSRIALGMNKPFERYARLYIAPIATVLSDQKPNIRASAIKTLADIASACEGMDPLVGGIATGLETQNPLQRSSLLNWIAEWLATHPPSSALDLAPWVAPVVACLDDRSADVRRAAQALLPHLIKSVGYDRVVNETGSLKPATRSAVLPLIQAARQETNEPSSNVRGTSVPPPQQKQDGAGAGTRPTGLRGKKIAGPPDGVGRTDAPNTRPTTKTTQSSAAGSTASTPPPHPPSSPSVEPFLFTVSSTDTKKGRLSKDAGRWIIETGPVRKDLLELLHHQMEGHVSKSLLVLLFSTDHNAVNDYMTGMSQLCTVFTEAASKIDEASSLALISNCDLVLKYACTKIHEPQPNLISKSLDLLHSVVEFLRSADYQLSDGEAQLFIPTVIHKLGDAREAVRSRVQQLIQLLPRIYAFSRIFQLLLEHGLKSKVSKARQGSLDELANILKRSGTGVCDPAKALPLVAAMISDKDPSVRKSALGLLSEAYVLTGDKIWSYIGIISSKDRTQLEERLRRIPPSNVSGKELANPAVAKISATNTRPASPSRVVNGQRAPSPATNIPSAPNPLPKSTSVRAASPSHAPSRKETSSLPAASALPGPSGLRKSHLPSRLARAPPQVSQSKPETSEQARRALRPLNLGSASSAVASQAAQPEIIGSERSFSPSSDDISLVISSILSNDANRSVDALKKIQKGLEVPDANREASSTFQGLAEHSEGLIETITVQVSHVFDRVEDLAEPSNFRLAKHLMQTLHSFFSHAVLAESLTVDTVTSLLEELTLRLLQTDESPDVNVKEISRFINLILLKIFASGKRISVFRSLFSLLLKIVKPFPANRTSADSQEAKVAELVLKCIWKLARNIPGDLDKQLLDPAEFFPTIERCLQAIPPNDWRARATNKVPCGDMPLRTIKVIIQHVVAKYGDQVYDFLSGAFDDPSATIVYPYVYRILNSASRQEGDEELHRGTTQESTSSLSSTDQNTGRERSSSNASTLEHQPDSPRENGHRSLPSSSLDDSDPDIQLLHIIGNISSESTGALHKEGITQLYQFLKAYPHKKSKVDKMLESTGPAFRKYLARALASRAAEDEEREAAVADTLSRLEAVRKEPMSPTRTSTISPKRTSGASDGTAADSDKLSRLHTLFQYRGSDGASRISGDSVQGKTNGH